jgi:beta-lactamase superfamily II metal-dependent hydrolase
MIGRSLLWCLIAALMLTGCNVDPVDSAPQATLAPGVGGLQVAFLDVGQGESILIRAPNGQTMLIDGGRTIEMADQVILPQLKAWGAQQVDVMVVTHPDADHISGLVGVLEKLPVALVALTGDQHATQIYERLLLNIRDKNIKALKVRTGTTIPFDPAVKLEVLGPDDDLVNQPNTNDGSIVIKLTYGQTSFLLTGDAEFAENLSILRRGADVRSTVLKLGHHGSSSSTDENWLRAVQPQLGIISSGKDNPYGHPHVEVIRALNKLNIPHIRTDEHGTITIASDGSQMRVTSQR